MMAELGSLLIKCLSGLPYTTLKTYFVVDTEVHLLHSGIPFHVHLVGALFWRKGN